MTCLHKPSKLPKKGKLIFSLSKKCLCKPSKKGNFVFSSSKNAYVSHQKFSFLEKLMPSISPFSGGHMTCLYKPSKMSKKGNFFNSSFQKTLI